LSFGTSSQALGLQKQKPSVSSCTTIFAPHFAVVYSSMLAVHAPKTSGIRTRQPAGRLLGSTFLAHIETTHYPLARLKDAFGGMPAELLIQRLACARLPSVRTGQLALGCMQLMSGSLLALRGGELEYLEWRVASPWRRPPGQHACCRTIDHALQAQRGWCSKSQATCAGWRDRATPRSNLLVMEHPYARCGGPGFAGLVIFEVNLPQIPQLE